MKLSLVVLNAGKAEGQRIPITLSQFVIGRDPECNLRPASAIISKRHCALIIKDGKVSVRDFDSTNGTYVNDVRITGEAPLNDTDLLKVGPLTFKVAIEVKAATSKVTPPPPRADETSDDDSVAAMLLSLHEESAGGAETKAADESGVPAGSTVMDIIPFPNESGQTQQMAAVSEEKKTEKKKDADPAHMAAKAILDKYTRRSRG